MKALTHITAGRTAIRALLVAVVLTAGIAGTAGTAAAEPMDGKGNDVPTLPPSLYSFDGTGNDVLYESLDGKGNDVVTESLGWLEGDTVTASFPVDDVTVFAATYVGRGGGSGKPSF
jgi:hypothetical protein